MVRSVALVVFLGACGRIAFDPTGAAPIDATDAAVDAATLGPFGPFAEPTIQSQVNSNVREYGTAISGDGLELYFASYRMPNLGGSDVWRATRADRASAFGPLETLGNPNGTNDDGEPTVSTTGLELYIGRPGFTILGSTRDAPNVSTWSYPLPVPSLTGFEGPDFGPGDLRIVVSRSGQLYEATRASTSDPWGTPQLLSGLGTMEDFPSLRGDGLELFWESRRLGPSPTIFHALRPAIDQPFGTPERLSLGTLDNASTGDPDISADGRVLVFVAIPGPTEYDIYVTQREPL